jgi:hypothetical protein
MKYEYKVIELTESDESMTSFDKLQKWFDEGWEYVDSITQPIAVGSGVWKSAVGIVLRKEKSKNPLD